MNFIELTAVSDQTLVIVPRWSGQVLRLGAQEVVTEAGVPARVYGTGIVELGEGFWDSCTIVDGFYDGAPFDGNTPADGANRYFWDGEENASTSRRLQVLTPLRDMNPVPRILIDLVPDNFPAGSVTVSLTRTAEGRTFAVRGGQNLPAGSPAVVVDSEAPFGIVSSYTVVGYDEFGNMIGSLPAGSVTLECDLTVIQQPLDARLSVAVERMWKTGQETSRPTPFDLTWPQGRALPGLVGLGPRRGFQGVQWELLAASHDDADRLQETLGTYEQSQIPVWLIRTPVDHVNPTRTQRIPRVFFCAVTELTELDTLRLTDQPGVHFMASTTEVQPPAPGVTATVLTYADVNVFYSTYSAVKARYATYSDVKRDTSLIGAADA